MPDSIFFRGFGLLSKLSNNFVQLANLFAGYTFVAAGNTQVLLLHNQISVSPAGSACI